MRKSLLLLILIIFAVSSLVYAGSMKKATSYAPVVITEDFSKIMARMKAEKPKVMKRQMALLEERYNLSNRPAKGVTMSGGKAVQEGVRVKLPKGVSWSKLTKMSPEEIRNNALFPSGFYPLPHPNHPEGGMVFPKFHINEIKKQEGRDLTRFDLDFDLPDHFLPEFPAPIYLTTRPDLGDVSQGKVITIDNYFEIFNGILNPKQLEGLRLLITPFPQQQFNQTDDRRSERPSRGVTCFDCHTNGHTNATTHLVGDIRPQEFRHRLDTPTLRGVNIQRLFGSQRALKSIEDFAEFEQRAAYFEAILDFPPAPKLDIYGMLDPKKANKSEMKGQEVFFGKGKCSVCHVPPYYTDNLMHNLKTERFYKPKMINGRMASADGPIKTFPLRGIKDSPPYLHDERLLTLEDTVEFFNLILGTDLKKDEKKALVDFMRQL